MSDYIRPRLRQASMIIPTTGERIRRAFTFATHRVTRTDSIDDSEEDTPFLEDEHNTTNRRSRSERGMALFLSWIRIQFRKLVRWLDSFKARLIFKCALAYLLASMFTYVGPFSNILGKGDGKHMVATITVYFHPARSLGAMYEASLFAFLAIMYHMVVSSASLATSMLFEHAHQLALGHAIVLIVFCGGGLGFLGYMKLKMGSITVNVACSLAALNIVTLLTKEGSVQIGQFAVAKLTQTMLIFIFGIIISSSISFFVWPTSADKQLRQAMIKSTDSFSEMLENITKAFITGSEELLLRPSFQKSAVNHRTVFTVLSKHFAEAKYEHYVRGSERVHQLEKELIESMQRLAQNIGGLQSAARTQFALLNRVESSAPSVVIPMSTGKTPQSPNIFSPPTHSSPSTPLGSFVPIDYRAPLRPSRTSSGKNIPKIDSLNQNRPADEPLNSKSLFDGFINHLGPSMKSLAVTLQLLLNELPFEPGPTFLISVNPKFETNLKKALELYSTTRIDAINELYKSPMISMDKNEEHAANQEEVAASCGHFSYSLENFGEEMMVFLHILTEMQVYQDHPWKSWTWLKFWRRNKAAPEKTAPRLPEAVPPIRKHVPNTVYGRPIPFSYKIWKTLKVFRRDQVKFALKTGIGAALWTLPAFIPQTRPTFQHWRGEWGLVSYMIVMSMTLGATNTSIFWRVLGTFVGAGLTLVAWVLFPGRAVPLALFGWAISIPCFYLHVNTKKIAFGRFILLTYNISALYAYSLSVQDTSRDEDDDDEGGINPIITSIVYHRVVSVLSGVAWGLIINRYVWPISARSKIREGLSVLWLRMALIWKRDPLNSLIEGESEHDYMNISEEIVLQKGLIRLDNLLAEVPFEFRLKGPFPVTEYKDIFASTQGMLDAFHSMNVMISKDRATRGETDILSHTEKERADLCGRIFLLFYTISSCIRSGFPLPQTLPNTDRARHRLLTKLHKYRQRIRGSEGQNDADFALLYAYALVTATISEGLTECANRIETLYGVLDEELLEIS